MAPRHESWYLFPVALAALLTTLACGDSVVVAPEANPVVPEASDAEIVHAPTFAATTEPTFLYAFENSYGRIFKIDVPPGSKHLVGDSGPGGASGMATSSAPFIFGTKEYPAGTHVGLINNTLIVIDTEDGSREVLRNTTRAIGGRGIAFGPDGKTLYIIESSGVLSTVNFNTGVVTPVKTTLAKAASLEWDPEDELFYALYNSKLYGLNADGTLAKEIALTGSVKGTPCTIARRPDDDTWYTMDGGGLYSIDTNTGATALLGNPIGLGNLCGTAFAPEHAINEAPTDVSPGGPYSGPEGSAITFAGTGTDPEGTAVTFHWNFGDGSTATGQTVEHAYGDDGIYVVTLTVRDADNIGTIAATTATISNVDPVPTIISADDAKVNEDATLVFSFTDPGWLDNWTVSINWNEGGPSAWSEITDAVAGTPYTATHLYTEPGTYLVSVTVVDHDGGAVYQTANITVTGDLTSPVISVDVTGTTGNDDWYTSDVSVAWTITEPESPESVELTGCVDTVVDYDTTGETFTCAATSDGGDALPVSVTVMVDRTDPDIAFSGGLSYDISEVVDITCAATDETSEIASATCPGASGDAVDLGPGSFTLLATATDNAGNATSAQVTFEVTVSFDGVCALVQRMVSHAGVANSLCAKLRAAEKARNDNARRGPLGAFINEVQAQNGKKIDPADAVTLIELADYLMP